MNTIKIDGNLKIRALSSEDAEHLLVLSKNYTGEWLYLNSNLEGTRKFISSVVDKANKKEAFGFGIWWKNELSGYVSLDNVDYWAKNAGISYMLGNHYRGVGIATKACAALVRYAFEEMKLHRIWMGCDTENIKSFAVAERLGFKKEGLLHCNRLTLHPHEDFSAAAKPGDDLFQLFLRQNGDGM